MGDRSLGNGSGCRAGKAFVVRNRAAECHTGKAFVARYRAAEATKEKGYRSNEGFLYQPLFRPRSVGNQSDDQFTSFRPGLRWLDSACDHRTPAVQQPKGQPAGPDHDPGCDHSPCAEFPFGRTQLLGRLFDYLSFYASASWHLWRRAARGDVVIAGTDPPLFSVCAASVSRLTGTRLINWLQDLFPEVARALQIRGCGRWLARGLSALRDISLQCADANVVPGGGMASYLSRRGISEERIWIRHNWSDGTKVRPVAPDENRLRREWHLLGKFVVGYSGNMGGPTTSPPFSRQRQHCGIALTSCFF